jgi:hypothetical protein
MAWDSRCVVATYPSCQRLPTLCIRSSPYFVPLLRNHVLAVSIKHGVHAQGESRDYYRASNSLLPCVLIDKKGIPISLAVVHAAVGRRAGLPIDCIGMPMHLINRMLMPGSDEECFIDVFRGGQLLTRCAQHFKSHSAKVHLLGQLCIGRVLRAHEESENAWPHARYLSASHSVSRMIHLFCFIFEFIHHCRNMQLKGSH